MGGRYTYRYIIPASRYLTERGRDSTWGCYLARFAQPDPWQMPLRGLSPPAVGYLVEGFGPAFTLYPELYNSGEPERWWSVSTRRIPMHVGGRGDGAINSRRKFYILCFPYRGARVGLCTGATRMRQM